MAMTDHPNSAELVNTVWKKMAIYYAMTNAAGKGAVKALPVYKDPLVQYGITQEEKQHLAEGLKKLCELLFAAGAEVLYPSIAGSSPLHSMEDVNKLPASIPAATSNLMTIHLFSSCPMGENRHVCATDSYGKLHGVEGLYINDASLLPTALGVNPQGTVMAFALRNIDHFIKHTS
jgi:choline dehydrogenase-like flavoprotein